MHYNDLLDLILRDAEHFEHLISVTGMLAGLLCIRSALRHSRPPAPEGIALTSLTRPQRTAVARVSVRYGLAGALILSSCWFGLVAAVAASGPKAAAACDDTMLEALHPQLALNTEDHSTEQLARRFLLLTREVTPSEQCNIRSLQEAAGLATQRVTAQLGAEARRVGFVQFLDRRRTENVALEFLSTTSSGPLVQLRWVEHVHSPRGVSLRTEHYTAQLRVTPRTDRPARLQVTELTLQEQPPPDEASPLM